MNMVAEENMNITPKEIRKKIENLLETKFFLPQDVVFTENRDYPFFGLRSILSPRGLTYLTYLLEKYYRIQFGAEEYDDPMFYSLDGLSEIIAQLVKDRAYPSPHPKDSQHYVDCKMKGI